MPTPSKRSGYTHYKTLAALVMATAFLTSGCMFDVVSVKQLPATFSVVSAAPREFTLNEYARVSIGTGFATKLYAGTHWTEIGVIEQGVVYRSKDQILTVEASNIHEAALVVDGDAVTGFYLLVEKTFCPAKVRTNLKK